MSQAVRSRGLAVLETSFWVAAHQATVAANCFDYFDIVVPVAVEREIRSIQAGARQVFALPGRAYPFVPLPYETHRCTHINPFVGEPAVRGQQEIVILSRSEEPALRYRRDLKPVHQSRFEIPSIPQGRLFAAAQDDMIFPFQTIEPCRSRLMTPAQKLDAHPIQAADSRREYPYATLFRHLRDRMVDPPSNAPPALSAFGPGEAAALPLAEHLNATLLVNERQATQYAVRRGLKVLTVPIFVVGLCDQGVISKRAAERKLELLQSMTSRLMIAEAQILLEGL